MMMKRDWITTILLLVNALFYAFNYHINGTHAITGLTPQEVLDAGGMNGQTSTLSYLTSMFAHGSFMHFFMNMATLLALGGIVKDSYGSIFYLFTYVVSGFSGAILSAIVQPDIATLGASGSIYGLLGMLIVGVLFKSSLTEMRSTVFFLVFVNLIYTFLDPNINATAHITGMVVGIVLSFISLAFIRRT